MMHKIRYIIIGLFLCSYLFSNNAYPAEIFAGQPAENDVIFMRSRFYDPETGQFLTKDPIGIAGGLNTYTYVSNNPVNYIDPDGKNALVIAGLVAAGIVLTPDIIAELDDPNSSCGWADMAALIGTSVISEAVLGKIVSFFKGGTSSVTNPIPETMARVVPIPESGAPLTQLGKQGMNDVFVTAADDIAGMNAKQIAQALGIPESPTGYYVAEFSTPQTGVASPVFRSNPGFVGGGQTSGGVREFVIPNQTLEGLGAVTQVVTDSQPYTYLNPQLSGLTLSGFGASSILNVGGVLIDKAAQLVGSNLSDIKGATFDPVSKQIVFLGSNTNPQNATSAVNMDYFYTAIQAVYGSAQPPFVTLDPPASQATNWTDYGNNNGAWDNAETNGFILRYNPLWSGEDTTVDIRIRASANGTQYDFTLHFNAEEITNITAGDRHPMRLVYNSVTTTLPSSSSSLPSGISFNSTPFAAGNTPQSLLLTSTSQDSYWPVQLTNNTGQSLTNVSFSVIPARQHRKYGGRVDGTKLGWVMYEADRVMKCLSVGKDNLTGALYNSSTVSVSGYKNLLERAEEASMHGSFNARMWFVPDEMTLQRYIDPNTGQASIIFSQSSVALLTESYLQGLPADPIPNAFATHFKQNYDAFAALNFPVIDPDCKPGDANYPHIINVPIFAMLKQAMQAVSLARFFRDNNIPLDMWWLNSWEPPVAYSPKSVATAYNTSGGGTTSYTIFGGVQITTPNSYVPSSTAGSVGQTILAARPADSNPVNPDAYDLKSQIWTASTSQGTLKAVAASMTADFQDGNVNLNEPDLVFKSPGSLPLAFTRYYQSSWLGNGNMGPGWRNTRYVLQFSSPSWYDQNHMMKDSSGNSIATDSKSDTRLRSGTIRLVDLASGKQLDFQSSLNLDYALDSLGNPYVSINGLTANHVPTFTPGQYQSGATLAQTEDSNKYYVVTMPDGSYLTFNSDGTPLQTVDRHGYHQDYGYDDQGHLVTITDGASQTITLAYDSATGMFASATGLNNVGTTYHYDANKRLTSVVHVPSNAVIAEYTYNDSNQLVDVTRMDGLKPVTTTADEKGRSATRLNSRNNSLQWFYSKNSNDLSRVSDAWDPNSGFASWQQGADKDGRPTYIKDALNNYTLYGYTGTSLLPNSIQPPTPSSVPSSSGTRPAISITRNAMGLPTAIHDPAVQGAQPVQVNYTASNLPQQITDTAGRATDLTYTTSNNLQRMRRYHNSQNIDTTFGYQNEFLHTVSDPLDNTWTYNRDTVGRVTSVQDPTGVTIAYDYDTHGRLWKVHDPRLSAPVIYSYDDLNRVTSVQTPLGTTSYTYDPVKTWLASSTTTTTDGQTRTVQYSYNNQTGDITSTTYQLPQAGGGTIPITTAYSYTAYGDLASVTPSGAQPINFNYNALGQLLDTSETSVGLTVGPTIIANNATSGVWTNQNNQTFVWSVPTDSLPIVGYNYAKDASITQTVNTTELTTDWNAIPDGQHTFKVCAKDAEDNWSPESVFNLWVDATPPVLNNWEHTPAVPASQNSKIPIKVTITDATSGLSGNPKFRWCVATGSERSWSDYSNMTNVSGNIWSTEINTDLHSDAGKTFYYQVQAQDVAGNVTTSDEQSLPIEGNDVPFILYMN